MTACAFFITPTVAYFTLDDEATAEVRADPAAFDKYVPSWAPTNHIVPGLDLQGGILMVLGVDLEKAIADRAGRTAGRVRSTLDDKKVAFKDVIHLREEGAGDRLRVEFNDEASKTTFVTEIFDDYFGPSLTVVDEDTLTILYRVHPDYAATLKKEAVDQTIKTITNRIDSIGVVQPKIERSGDDKIQIQLPGYDDPEEAKSLIGRTAQLEFVMTDDDTEFLTELTDLPVGVTLQRSSFQRPDQGLGKDIYLLFPQKLKATMDKYVKGKMPSATQLMYGDAGKDADGNPQLRTYTLKTQIEITGEDLVDARVQQGNGIDVQTGVGIDFSPAGGKLFGELTGKNIGNRMAIVLEEIVNSAPVIQTAITGGSAQITMGRGRSGIESLREAQDLALVLKSGALPAPVQFRQETSVGPSLGKVAVAQGKNAFMAGGIFVILFMLIYYRLAGIISIIGLLFNVAFLTAFMSWWNATVTLPGLAGLLLTIGMAVDANIIIIERIREELRAGKTPRSAVGAGYDHALSAIIDANVTTLIAGFVLYQFGTGPVKNFAFTLLIGTVSSVVSAIVITRIFFDMAVSKGPEDIAV